MNDQVRQVLHECGVDLSTETALREGVTFYVTPGGPEAVELWHRLRERMEGMGVYPVLCGSAEDLEDWKEVAEDWEEVAEVLAQVPEKPPLDELKNQATAQEDEMMAFMKEHSPELGALMGDMMVKAKGLIGSDDEEQDEPWQEQPENATRLPAMVADMTTGEPHDCILALLETNDPTAAPAFLDFGGFNNCPSPEVHVSFLRDWHQRFGAVPICLTADVLEVYVPRPVETQEACLALAKEFHLYAPDIVEQGTQTEMRLAMELWKRHYWSFWWD